MEKELELRDLEVVVRKDEEVVQVVKMPDPRVSFMRQFVELNPELTVSPSP